MSTSALEKQCPKCQAPMTPGCPVESTGEMRTKAVTAWADGLPRMKKSIFGQQWAVPATGGDRYVLGFCCTKCGLIELYAVDKQQLEFHATRT